MNPMQRLRKQLSFVALIVMVLSALICTLPLTTHADRVYGPPSGSDYVLKYKNDVYVFIENRLNFETRRLPLQGSKEAEQGMENMANTLYEDILEEIEGMEPIQPEDYPTLFTKRWYRMASNSFSNIITTDPQVLAGTKLMRVAGDNGYKMNDASRRYGGVCLWKVVLLALSAAVSFMVLQ